MACSRCSFGGNWITPGPHTATIHLRHIVPWSFVGTMRQRAGSVIREGNTDAGNAGSAMSDHSALPLGRGKDQGNLVARIRTRADLR